MIKKLEVESFDAANVKIHKTINKINEIIEVVNKLTPAKKQRSAYDLSRSRRTKGIITG